MHDPVEQTNSQTEPCIDRLRRLPSEMLPPYDWQEFQRRARHRLPVTGNRLNWRHMAAAAVLLVVVCGIAVWGRIGGDAWNVAANSGFSADKHATWMPGTLIRADHVSPDAVLTDDVSPDDGRTDDMSTDDVDALRGTRDLRRAQDSRAIESWLASLPREPIVVRVGTRAAVTRLEDRIAQVDDLLSSVRLEGLRPERLAALQKERVRLVGSLAQVRYAEVVASESP